MTKSFTVRPIGYVKKTEEVTWLELDAKFIDGLLQLDAFSHVIVLWWIEGRDTPEDRQRLQAHPCVKGRIKNTPLSGVFAIRSPFRPNPIGLTIVKIIKISENKIIIDYIDAFDETPILDLKPYIPNSDTIQNVKVAEFMEPLKEPRKE
jgi:tRNA-Thr(GGU) m(6)t(6)A37 methyltransferase TsaA